MAATARDLITLLEQRHAGDVFVAECKDGPTHAGQHVRLDGWAMKRSWANPLVVGYEIKVSRSDFLNDNKWPAYLPMCNQLYFVCPTGLIQPPEVPGEVGLLWAAKTGTRLYTKAKAAHRDIEIPEPVWRYVLMCRAVITREHRVGQGQREFWEAWLKQKKLDREFGYRVSKALRERVNSKIVDVEIENKRLKKLVDQYDDIRQMLTSLGINPESEWECREDNVLSRLERAREILPSGLLWDLDNLSKTASQVREKLAELDGGKLTS
ncbi:hypothetical protein LCGC14_2627870 [marine sediment metagenome]|uniref:DNA repair protein MmcB-related protein n=1 Tax=marine sediment metagenome TaxID=412755 RepID=A0A0F9CC93_9ZZZZ